MYKLLHKIDDYDYTKMFTVSTNVHDLRGYSLKLIKHRVNKSVRINSFPHRVINDWNMPNDDIVLMPIITTFKAR